LFLVLSAILFINQACSQSPSSTDPTETSTSHETEETGLDNETGDVVGVTDEDQTEGRGREAMVFVVDPDYNPLPNAVIGTDSRYADMFGVFIGEVSLTDSGWLPISAPGFVTNYAKPSPFSGEIDLYFVTLAPVVTTSYYGSGSGSTLQVDQFEDPLLKVELAPGALTEEQGYLELTTIDPRKISMDDAWAELDNPYGQLLSFDISAWNLEGKPLALDNEKSAVVTIQDSDHDVNDLVLQSFDPELGTWTPHTNACVRVDQESIQCSLDHFSMHSFLDRNLEDWQLQTEEIDDFRMLFYTVGEIYKSGEEDGTLTDASADLVSILVKKLAEIAKDFANRNKNETGKAMLVYTAQLAQTSGAEGGEAIANDLIKQAQDLTAEMAKKLEETADCGHTDEIIHLIEQGQYLGGSAKTAADDLLKKVKDQLDNCVIWIGNIHYMFFLLDEFPELEGHWHLQEKNEIWHEYQSVRIGINPVTGILSGTSKVRSVLDNASYVADIGSDDCGVDKHYMDIEGNPGIGFATLTFEGTYQDQVWSIEPMQEKDTQPAVLFLHQHGLFGCPKVKMELSNTQMFTYKSQLLHGFWGTPQPPNLEEMLNTGNYKKSREGYEFILGNLDISYSSGVNRVPLIPVDHANLNWSFKRFSTTTMD
jgi:hypothetical protein